MFLRFFFGLRRVIIFLGLFFWCFLGLGLVIFDGFWYFCCPSRLIFLKKKKKKKKKNGLGLGLGLG